MLGIKSLPDPLPVPITRGKRGPWTIETFTLSDTDVMMSNLRAVRDGNAELLCKPGTYTGLYHATRGVVMSNTPMEVRTNQPIIRAARGRVLMSGLGLGMALRAVLDKPEVEHVTVHEIDPDIIALVGPGFATDVAAGRCTIVEQDAFAYRPKPGERYDVAWHDVWDDISAGNLKQMGVLRRRWSQRCTLQLCWSEMMARRQQRRDRAYA